jgi:DNA polymerase elongation subunit (family B)
MRRLDVSVSRLRVLVDKYKHRILWCGTDDDTHVLVDTILNGHRYKYRIDLQYEYDMLPAEDVIRNGEADIPLTTVAFVPTNTDFFAPLRKASALGVNAGGSCTPGSGQPADVVPGCVCGYDIELNMSLQNRGEFPLPDVGILSCALWCTCGYRAFLTSMDMVGENITGSLSSCDIVSRTIDLVAGHKPQWLVGWNNFAFDNTCMHFHVDEPYKSMFKQVKTGNASTVDYGYILNIEGVYNADPFCYFQRSAGHNYDDMSLAGVASAEKVTAKKDMPDLAGAGDPYEIMDYNMTDSAAAAEIWVKTRMSEEIFNLAVCSCAPVYDCVRYMTGAIWGMAVSSECIYEGKIMDWSKPIREVEYAGGMVLDPVLGVHDDVIIVDFSSMYPTIMIDGRISPESIVVVDGSDKEYGHVEYDDGNVMVHLGPFTAVFPRDSSPVQRRILLKMTSTRSRYKKSNPPYANALKVTSNSGYGAMGYPNSPMFGPLCAASVTSIGRFLINLACDVFTRAGLRVLYGDTDSCMIGPTSRTREDFNNDVYAHYEYAAEQLREAIQATPFKSMDMSFESYHPRVMFLGKKKYCKLNTDGSITYKGVSVVRSDTLGIAKHCFSTVSSLLLNCVTLDEAKERIAQYVCHVVECAYNGVLKPWDVSKVRKQDGRKCYFYHDVYGEEKAIPIDMATNTVPNYSTSKVLRVFREELMRICGACGLGSPEDILLKSNVFM